MKENHKLPIMYAVYFVALFSLVLPTNGYAASLCSDTNATLDCLSKNFRTLYATNYSLFWDILHRAAKQAQECKSILDAVRFLKLVSLKSINAEFNEFFSEVIENLCIKNTKCFFEASIRLKEEDQVQIVRKLRSSVFANQADITEVFEKNKNSKRYKKFVELYFQYKEEKKE